MDLAHRRMPTAVAVALGLIAGLLIASYREPTLRAGGGSGDRSGESIIATGPILTRYDESSKVQVSLDALYYLDYQGGRLVTTIPSYRQGVNSRQILDAFTERDLVVDFKLEEGDRPHFLMTTGELGSYGTGWAPLYVFETTTDQVAVYKADQTSVGNVSKPTLELVEIRSLKTKLLPAGQASR